jgi:hypothetical protein
MPAANIQDLEIEYSMNSFCWKNKCVMNREKWTIWFYNFFSLFFDIGDPELTFPMETSNFYISVLLQKPT